MRSSILFLVILLTLSGITLTVGTAGPMAVSRSSPPPLLPGTTANTIVLTAFGAVGDGIADDGPALQSALNALADAGGGTLLVPAGRYAIITPVLKDFSGTAASVSILGVASSTPVNTQGDGQALTRGLDLTSEFVIRTGVGTTALTLRGLETLVIAEMVFIGTQAALTDAQITLGIYGVANAEIRHSEFYGLSTLARGGAVVHADNSRLTIDRTVFLGCTGNSGVRTPVVLSTTWKGFSVTESIFADYGQRPNYFGKLNLAAPYSWIMVGNTAASSNLSPRREAFVRNVFLDEGGFVGISVIPDFYNPQSAASDLIYISDLRMNVTSLRAAGVYVIRARRVLIERAKFGLARFPAQAVSLLNVAEATLDRLECRDGADTIYANANTGRLTVINSIYTHLASQAHVTEVITTDTENEDPVQYARQQYLDVLGHEPDAAGHDYWSDILLECGSNQTCLTARRLDLLNYLNTGPSPFFSVTGQILDEDGAGMPGVALNLSGSQTVSTQTDAQGNYRFEGLPTSGVYTLTPVLVNHTFDSSNWTITTPSGDAAANFTAILNNYSIAGRILNSTGQGLSGATVTVSGSQAATTITTASGNYSFTVPAEGDYTVSLTKVHYGFVPPSTSFSNLGGNQIANFAGTLNQHAITGQITGANGNALAGVTVSLSGDQVVTAMTNSNGTYTFNLAAGGNYTLAPAKQNYVFSPPSRVFNDLGANQVANFTGALVNYSIAGQVTNATGQGLSGATVTLSGSQAATTRTDESGNYNFVATGDGSYTVSVAKVHYGFSPPSAFFGNLSGNQIANFAGTLNQHAITGQITGANGNALAGVTVTLSGTQVATAISSSTGTYTFSNLAAGGNYGITTEKQNYIFSPPSRVFNDLGANQVANFTGALLNYSIAGRVFNAAGQGISGATVTLSGSQAATTTTNASGNYSFVATAEGSYSVSVAKLHYSFSLPSSSFSNLSENQTANFTGTLNQHSISGLVRSSDGNALAGVSLSLAGSQSALVVTGADGRFSITVPAGGAYTLVPTKTNYLFAPLSVNFTNLDGSRVADFAATLIKTLEFSAASYQIVEGEISLVITVVRNGDTSGPATATYSTSAGSGINNCHIPHTEDASSGCDYITSIGTVRFAAGETSKTFFVPIIDDGYAEGSENFEVTLSNLVGANMGSRGTAAVTITDNETVDGANPIEGAGSFVRQHYIDFFNREPDPAGLAFWTNEIIACGSDAACVDLKRTNASAAFFVSTEFRETGYLVYRTYKAAYDNLAGAPVPVRFGEFLPDTRQIGLGVVVGETGWAELLENNKEAFAADFVARPRFINAYATTLTPTQFVDALFTNAGVTPSADERTTAINEFGPAETSAEMAARGRALRRVAENQTLAQQEFNKAFVLIQYFGYLRRNPNDAPEATLDFQGYNFWLGKLNQFNGNFINADMVKAFIISAEYRQRFGP